VADSALVPAEAIQQFVRPVLGQLLWRVPSGALQDALLKNFPALQRATIAAWPWGRLDITVVQRTGLARVEGAEQMLIDEQGAVFCGRRPDGGLTGQSLPVMRIAGTTDDGRRRALTMLQSADSLAADWVIDPGVERDIRLVLPGGTPVHFGDGRFTQRWQALYRVLADLERNPRPVAAIDLRFSDQAIVTTDAPPAPAAS
jgi:hypothetical protein